MSDRLCVWLVAAGMTIAATRANGQATPDASGAPAAAMPAMPATQVVAVDPAKVPPIPIAVAAIAGAASQDDKAAIKAFIEPLLQCVTAGTGAQQHAAKERFVTFLPQNGATPNVSAQFMDAYSDVLNAELKNVLSANPPPNIRLVVGVIAARVAERTKSAQLTPTATLLLNDPFVPAILWGMKTAKFILPDEINVQPRSALPALIEKVAIKYPGPVLNEAYNALTLLPLELAQYPKKVPAAKPQIVIVMPHVLGLLESRIHSFGPGTAPTADDSLATNFLINSPIWALETASDQKRALKAMCDLISAGSPVFAAITNTSDRQDITTMMQRLGSGFAVVAQSIDNAALQAAGVQLQRTNNGESPATLAGQVNAVVQIVAQLPLMAGGAGATTAPSTPSSVASGLEQYANRR